MDPMEMYFEVVKGCYVHGDELWRS